MADNDSRNENIWVFLSHSHHDLEKVRLIRNELERIGFNPLIFFLKCLEDDNAELPDLLRREIEARNWFILCNSPNAEASKWVKKEIAIIKSMKGKVYEEIDLSKFELGEERHNPIERLAKRATVFISYSGKDSDVANRVADALESSEYKIFIDFTDLKPGQNWMHTIQLAIDNAIEKGFVLLLLSPAALESLWVKQEIFYAVSKMNLSGRNNVVPVVIKDRDNVFNLLPNDLKYILSNLHYFDLTEGDFNVKMNELIMHLKNVDVR